MLILAVARWRGAARCREPAERLDRVGGVSRPRPPTPPYVIVVYGGFLNVVTPRTCGPAIPGPVVGRHAFFSRTRRIYPHDVCMTVGRPLRWPGYPRHVGLISACCKSPPRFRHPLSSDPASRRAPLPGRMVPVITVHGGPAPLECISLLDTPARLPRKSASEIEAKACLNPARAVGAIARRVSAGNIRRECGRRRGLPTPLWRRLWGI